MDTKRFELFLRGTRFSESILAQLWSQIPMIDKIDFMLYCHQTRRDLPKEANTKALDDENPLVRMLASKSLWEPDEPDEQERKMIDKLRSDQNPFVRATTRTGSCGEILRHDEMLGIPHEERLAIIALSTILTDGEHFAKFIVKNIENRSLTEQEAGELVREYVCNPASADYIRDNPFDGLDWHGMISAFEAIWELTISTPLEVHDSIIWKYPFVCSGLHTIPDDILKKMDTEMLSKLVYRGYHPLIAAIKKNPDAYGKKLVKDVIGVEALGSGPGRETVTSDNDSLREEFYKFRNEIMDLLHKILARIRK